MLERPADEDERFEIAMAIAVSPPIARDQARRGGDSSGEAGDPSPWILNVAVVLDDVDDLTRLGDQRLEIVVVGAA